MSAHTRAGNVRANTLPLPADGLFSAGFIAAVRDLALFKAYENMVTCGQSFKKGQQEDYLFNACHGVDGKASQVHLLMQGEGAFEQVWKVEEATGKSILNPMFYLHRRVLKDVNVTKEAVSAAAVSELGGKPFSGRTAFARLKGTGVRNVTNGGTQNFEPCADRPDLSPPGTAIPAGHRAEPPEV